MSRVLYQLAGLDDHRFSPFSWRARMALAHKGLEAKLRDVKFSDRSPIAQSNQERVPVLVDGETWVADSWAIAEYLDATYPDAPSLLGSDETRAGIRFVNAWADAIFHAGIFGQIALDILNHTHADDREFFRTTREARAGMPLEDFQALRESKLEAFRYSLMPVRLTVKRQPYLGGEVPNFADYIVFGGFQWMRCASPWKALAEDDPINPWFEQVSALYDGLGASATGY
jgi:glutathione S-transferase